MQHGSEEDDGPQFELVDASALWAAGVQVWAKQVCSGEAQGQEALIIYG